MSRERKPPKMTGPFAQAAEDFIQYKRSCGFKYENEPKCLSRFCRFAEKQGVTSAELTRGLAEALIKPRENEAAKSRSHRATCVRQLPYTRTPLGMMPTFSRNSREYMRVHLCPTFLHMSRSVLSSEKLTQRNRRKLQKTCI